MLDVMLDWIQTFVPLHAFQSVILIAAAVIHLFSVKAVEKLTHCSFGFRVGYILNVTREIDNFFPGMFSYHNVRVYDEDATDLLAHWNDTYNFIVKAK